MEIQEARTARGSAATSGLTLDYLPWKISERGLTVDGVMFDELSVFRPTDLNNLNDGNIHTTFGGDALIAKESGCWRLSSTTATPWRQSFYNTLGTK